MRPRTVASVLQLARSGRLRPNEIDTQMEVYSRTVRSLKQMSLELIDISAKLSTSQVVGFSVRFQRLVRRSVTELVSVPHSFKEVLSAP